jgi:serine/threonine protein kinase
MDHERWREVEELFHAAIARPPQERKAFLDGACGHDTELRRCLEMLVSKDECAGSFLEHAIVLDSTLSVPRQSLLGRQFGPYRILAQLGAGGMGEVYRAHDGRLGRDVAVKTLPPEFAGDPDRLARFRHEARTLACLNHPNIAAIYGLEEHGELDLLVLELVEGETLRGPLRVPDALRIAKQIAEALETAHKKGIVHRDLKPANIKVTSEGHVKVLDFGLAKALWGAASGDAQQGSSQFPAVTQFESRDGRVVGTPAYMSPEQARGQEVDCRTDIWAFGCILYELLTGERAFQGATQDETLPAVLNRAPDWRLIPAKTPSSIRQLLRCCLRVDLNQRLSAIAGARTTLERAQRGRNWRTAAAGATVLLLSAAGFIGLHRQIQSADSSQWVQLTKFPDSVSQPALSPDGRAIAFIRSASTFFGVGQVYIKASPDGEPRKLTDDGLAKTNPAFSPDGAQIAYTTLDSEFHWDTWVVSTSGGEPRRWLRNISDLAWNRPGQIIFSERPRKAIVAAAEDLSSRHTVYVPPSDRGVARRPAASPDGKWVLLAELGEYGDWEPCRVVPMDGSSPGRQVGPTGSGCTSAVWSRDGQWMYLTSKSGGLYHIWRQHFPAGEPERLTSGLTEEEGVAIGPRGGFFVTAVTLQSASIWLHAPYGERQISQIEGNAAYPKFTPDGARVCYLVVKEAPSSVTTTYREPGDLWTVDLSSGRSRPLFANFPVHDYDISPDGTHVVMEADDRDGKPRLWLASIDGRTPPHSIPNVEGRQAVFGPGGEIFFRHAEAQSGFVYRVQPDGTGLQKALEQPLLAVTGVSPDGNWIEGWAQSPSNGAPAVQLFPLRGGPALLVGSNAWWQWSRDRHALWMQGGPIPDGHSYLIPLPRGDVLPRIPRAGFGSEHEIASIPGAQRIEATGAPGPAFGTYVFERRTIQRNLYRIPIL